MTSYFEFSAYEAREDFSKLKFHYKTTDSKGNEYLFTETLQLSGVPTLSENQKAVAESLLFNLHLILGTGYWKLFAPQNISIKSGRLNQKQAGFWNTVYTKGFGEFYYQNEIDFRDLIHFPFEETRGIKPSTFKPQDRVLLGLGGGKDSLVTADLLKENNISQTAFIIETAHQSDLVKKQLKQLRIDSIIVKRTLDPKLLAGSVPGAYKGHVPFSAITGFIGVLLAVLYDYKYVVVGNERSADEGNIGYLDQEINHQWSKTTEFEKLFRDYLHENIVVNLDYFSLNRPLSELKIAEIISKKPAYLGLFSSCNKNFKIADGKTELSWCGKCPKCAFTFILLAAFLPQEKLIDIFGKNLLEDSSLLGLYMQLLGKKDAKPFECVGTYDEVKSAFYLTHKKGVFEETQIMKFFVDKVLPSISDPEKLVEKELTARKPDTLPEQFRHIIEHL